MSELAICWGPECRESLPPPARRGGRVRRYCSERCKTRARRLRESLQAHGLPMRAPVRASSPPNPQRVAEALVQAMEGAAPLPLLDQAILLLAQADELAYLMAGLAPSLPARLGARFAALAQDIERAREHYFPPEVVPLA